MNPLDTQTGSREARYANHFEIGVGDAEVVIDFAQAYEGEPPVYHTRIVTAAAHARELVFMLVEALERERRRAAE